METMKKSDSNVFAEQMDVLSFVMSSKMWYTANNFINISSSEDKVHMISTK